MGQTEVLDDSYERVNYVCTDIDKRAAVGLADDRNLAFASTTTRPLSPVGLLPLNTAGKFGLQQH
jgi:hypothetical protein